MCETFSNRMRKAMELKNIKQSDIVQKTKIGKSSISQYLSGDYEPKQKNIFLIADALDVNEAWLMGYDIPMARIDKHSENKIATNDTLKLIESFDTLNQTGKNEALKRVNELTHFDKYTEKEHLIPIAAHNKDNIDLNSPTFEEDNKHDLDIMTNDDEWK
mgnify:CR=1 FL=1